jgi:hypothetical protein
LAFALLFFASPKVYGQGTLYYDLADLPDNNPGEDLWAYTYFVNGFSFQTNEGFSIFFDHQLYANLSNPQPSVSPIWSVIAVQPDVLLQAPGFLDALALVNSPSYQGPFEVTFQWLGTGIPGGQTFYTYNSSFTPTFSAVSAVPEPGTGLLASFSILFLLGQRVLHSRKMKHSQ